MCYSSLNGVIFLILLIIKQNEASTNMDCGAGTNIIKLAGTFDNDKKPSSTSLTFYNGDFCSFGQQPKTISYYCLDCIERCNNEIDFPNLLIISKYSKNSEWKNDWFKLNDGVNTDRLKQERLNCIVETITTSPSPIPETTTPNQVESDTLRSFSKTSVLFVSISFIILMVISLAWLVFYYVQRFRYAHAKDRLQRRLFNAARKALARIATRAIQRNDEELQTDCAVCLDPYQINDIVRILPCRHVYHKSCIDPWLLEHRTCPMCKSDILKHFGYQYADNQTLRNTEEGTVRVDIGGEAGHIVNEIDLFAVSPEGTSESSGSAGFSFDHSEHVETFQFTPTVPPQLVLNASNAKSFVMPMSGRIGSASGSGGIREQIQPTSYSARGHSRNDSTPHRVLRTSAGPSATTNTIQGGQSTSNGPQIVNLVQVKSRATSVTRAATIRKENMAQPTPIDVVIERPTTSTNTQVV